MGRISKGINYENPHPTANEILHGRPCPSCGQASRMILKCCRCGRVFCEKCGDVREDVFDGEKTGNILAVCQCGEESLFVD